MTVDGIGNARRLRDGHFDGLPGTYWAWPVDGYYDLHHVERGLEPDGSDVIEEMLPTIKAARDRARELAEFDRWNRTYGWES